MRAADGEAAKPWTTVSWIENASAAGSPDDCIEAITKLRDTLRMDYLIMRFRMAAGPAHEEELRCIRRFGRDVIPAFR
jgi:alkanesulfonate monooxygenase SsuD/methylene tetrahydromethanopterin reductase-like flavin-dependent oxidoreductase (luciferase family)